MLGAHPVSSHTLLRGPMLKSAHACHGVMWASLCKKHHVRIVPPANMTSWSTPTSIIAATRRCSVRMSARRRAVSPDANTTWMLASTKSKAVPAPEGTRQRKAQKNGSRENLLHDTAEKPCGQNRTEAAAHLCSPPKRLRGLSRRSTRWSCQNTAYNSVWHVVR